MSGWLKEDWPDEPERRHLTEKTPGPYARLDDPGPNAFLPDPPDFRRWDRYIPWLIIGTVAFLILCAAGAAWGKDVAVGDSIAAGTGKALGVETHAKVGAGSCAIIALVPGGHYDGAVISAGINDGGRCVGAVRSRVDADVIVWILPAPINPGYAAVRAVARLYGDRTVRYRCAGPCTRSNFHPASYQVVAKWVRIKWTGGRLPVAIFANPPVRNGR